MLVCLDGVGGCACLVCVWDSFAYDLFGQVGFSGFRLSFSFSSYCNVCFSCLISVWFGFVVIWGLIMVLCGRDSLTVCMHGVLVLELLELLLGCGLVGLARELACYGFIEYGVVII